MTKTIEVLKAARELISDPAHWTQGAFARDANGQVASPRGSEAVCFCAIGALLKVGSGAWNMDQPRDILEAFGVQGNYPITRINDHKDHKHILKVFDRAIKVASA